MIARLFFNMSDKRYMNKKLQQIGNNLNVELIEPTSVIDPDIILSSGTQIMKANYIFLEDFGRYYYINNYTFEYERIIAHCHVDVLMSFAPELAKENVIVERSNFDTSSLYLNDNELRMYNYSLFKTMELIPQSNIHFSDTAEQMVMICSGSI